MRLDLHVHTHHSGLTTIYPLNLFMKESYNSPEGVYRRAKATGMDLVTITDHDRIDGALTIAERPDVIVGCEVTGVFPSDGVSVHLGVLGITERQHAEVQRLRGDVRELLPYLKQERIFTSLNHVASGINGAITASHIAALMPWLDGIEIINGSRLPSQNMTASCLADACRKVGVAGSDSHTRRGIGRTWVRAPRATNRDEFMTELHAGRVEVGGRQGSYFTMASDMLRLAAGFYEDRLRLLAQAPLNWRRQAFVLGGLIGLPLIALPLAAAMAHFILEERFNRALLFDLVKRPAGPQFVNPQSRGQTMNVAIFTDNDFAKVNGVTTTLSAVLQCAPWDMRLRIYTAAPRPVEQPDYLALRSIGVPIPFYSEMRMYLPRLRQYVERARADRIDVVHLTTPGPIGLAALFVAWRLRLPLIGSFHTDLAAYTELLSGSRRLGALMREYMRWPYGRCARVPVPSHHTRALLLGATSNPERIEVWSRGVDTALFTPRKRSQALRDSWRVSEDCPALLYVGRVSREKGLSILPALRARLLASGLDHRFVIAGHGPMLRELQRQLPDAVFTGTLSRSAVAEVFASADAFVFPSRTDTAGNVVLEAQASGLPVVITSDGGPRENIVAGTTGYVCQSDNPHEWATAIGRALRSPGMGTAARQYALARRWEVALQPLYRAYREVTACVELQDRDSERAGARVHLLRS